MPGKSIGKGFKFKPQENGRTKVEKTKTRRTAVYDTIGKENKAKRKAAAWLKQAPGRVTVQKIGKR
jgi:hypothetical protein